eukprot:471019-Pleurochrysis_carterae.AAC.1
MSHCSCTIVCYGVRSWSRKSKSRYCEDTFIYLSLLLQPLAGTEFHVMFACNHIATCGEAKLLKPKPFINYGRMLCLWPVARLNSSLIMKLLENSLLIRTTGECCRSSAYVESNTQGVYAIELPVKA